MPPVLGSAVIIDCGSGITKAGAADDDVPSIIFHSAVGTGPKPGKIVGRDLLSSNALHFSSPIEEGVISNWDDVELLWRQVFHVMKANPEDHSVLLSESPFNPKINRETTAQIMFENFGVQGLFLAPTPLLSLYSSGKISGVVVECGHGSTITSPYLDGLSTPHAIQKSSIGGKLLTEFLSHQLKSLPRGKVQEFLFQGSDWKSYLSLQHLKEKLSRTGTLPVSESTTTYELPDGKTIDIPLKPFLDCGEALFHPSVCHVEDIGIHESVYQTVMMFDIESRKDLYSNIVLCGGTAMTRGLLDRMQDEMCSLAPLGTEVNVVAQSERQFSAWIGGQILVGMSNFEKMWSDKAEYDESGPTIVHRKGL